MIGPPCCGCDRGKSEYSCNDTPPTHPPAQNNAPSAGVQRTPVNTTPAITIDTTAIMAIATTVTPIIIINSQNPMPIPTSDPVVNQPINDRGTLDSTSF